MTSRPLTIAAIGRLKCNVPIRIKIREDLVETTALIDSDNKVQYPLIPRVIEPGPGGAATEMIYQIQKDLAAQNLQSRVVLYQL